MIIVIELYEFKKYEEIYIVVGYIGRERMVIICILRIYLGKGIWRCYDEFD